MRKLMCWVLFIALLTTGYSQSIVYKWAVTQSSTGSDAARNSATDGTGVYIVGEFSGTVDFDPGTGTSNLTSAGQTDVFIQKLSPTGTFMWAKKIGSTGAETASGISLDGSGNLYITGAFQGTVDFDPGTPTVNLVANAGKSNVYVLKLTTAAGAYVWSKAFVGAGDGTGVALSSNTTGVYIVGNYKGTLDFDPGAGTTNLSSQVATVDACFITKLDASGVFAYCKQLTNNNGCKGTGIVADATGLVFIAGTFNTDVDIDPGAGVNTVTSAGGQDVFVLKLFLNGSYQWHYLPGGSGSDDAGDIIMDASGNLYFAYNANYQLGTSIQRVIKLSGAGAWQFSAGPTNFSCLHTFKKIAFDSNGDLYGTGFFVDNSPTGNGSIAIGGTNYTPVPNVYYNYIFKLNVSTQAFTWSDLVKGINSTPTSISIFSPNTFCVTGAFSGTGNVALGSNVNNLTTSGSGDADGYIANYGLCTTPTVTGTGASRCGTGTVTLAATTSAGTISWYAASTGGTALGTGTSFTTPSISGTTTYYAESNNGGCISSPRTAVVATINAIPTVTGTGAARCGTGTVILTATPSAGTVSWFSALTGGTALATGNSFTTPSITGNTTYYVQSTNGSCTTSPRVAVTATVNAIPTVTGTGAARCGTGTVTLTATPSAGTVSWFSALTGGTALATGNSYTTPSITGNTTYYVQSTNGSCTTSPRVAVTATVNTIPTVSATGAAICGPGSVTLTATPSAGTVNWYSTLTGGTTIGSGNTFATPFISNNTTYYVEANNNGICTSSPRVAVTATINPIPTVTGTGAARCGTGAVTLTAAPSAGTVVWYTTLTGGTSLASGNSYTTPSISSNTTYYVEATNGSCTTSPRVAITATINTVPTVSAIGASRCGPGSVTLTATPSAGTVSWFSNSTGGSALATGNSFTTPNISTSTIYYVETNDGTCTSSAPRFAVSATVNTVPTITLATGASSCGPGTVNLYATPSSGTLSWFSTLTGGTAISNQFIYTTPVISNTTTYYAEANDAGCISSPRTAITATINIPNTNTIVNGNVITSLETVGSYQWLNCSLGYAPIASETQSSYTATSNGSYAVEVNLNGCRDTSACQNISGIGLLETDQNNTEFFAYPNPINNELHLLTPFNKNSQNSTVRIYALDGKLIYSLTLVEEESILQTGEWQKGIYILEWKTNNSTFRKRIIKL